VGVVLGADDEDEVLPVLRLLRDVEGERCLAALVVPSSRSPAHTEAR
jgi:hypothetical protein